MSSKLLNVVLALNILTAGVLVTNTVNKSYSNTTDIEVTQVPVVQNNKSTSSSSLVFDNKLTAKTLKKYKLPAGRTLFLYDVVREDNTNFLISRLSQMAADSRDPIYLLIDSPGGSVFDGSALVSAMESSRAPVYTVCVKMCASMAFSIHQHGTKRFMLDRSFLMAHDAAGGAQGYVSHMKAMIDFIARFIDKENAYVAARSGMNYNEYSNQVLRNIWVDAEDAAERKLTDGIISLNSAELDNSLSMFNQSFKEYRTNNVVVKEATKKPVFNWITE